MGRLFAFALVFLGGWVGGWGGSGNLQLARSRGLEELSLSLREECGARLFSGLELPAWMSVFFLGFFITQQKETDSKVTTSTQGG